MSRHLASAALGLAAMLSASNARGLDPVPWQFKPFRVFYAVTNGHHVKHLEVPVEFATREECDAWRRLDVAQRVSHPTVAIEGEAYLILGSYCRAEGIET